MDREIIIRKRGAVTEVNLKGFCKHHADQQLRNEVSNAVGNAANKLFNVCDCPEKSATECDCPDCLEEKKC